jgi:hypothetical protein
MRQTQLGSLARISEANKPPQDVALDAVYGAAISHDQAHTRARDRALRMGASG